MAKSDKGGVAYNGSGMGAGLSAGNSAGGQPTRMKTVQNTFPAKTKVQKTVGN